MEKEKNSLLIHYFPVTRAVATFIFISFAVGFAAAWFLARQGAPVVSSDFNVVSLRVPKPAYRFISPLLAEGDLEARRGYRLMQESVANFIRQEQKSGNILTASVFFKDLSSSRWFSVNPDEKYAPASLYKVALLITYLKHAEQDPTLLSRLILFSRSAESNDKSSSLTPGSFYTVRELLSHLIVDSDNDAKDLLHAHINDKDANEIFRDFGLRVPDPHNFGDITTVASYSLFFRILYNGTYLTDVMSDFALQLLSETRFTDGIVAGIPPGTKVSHKFGIRTFDNAAAAAAADIGVTEELHDCGIVYYPGYPYFVCVMTKGTDHQRLTGFIKTVSHMVYQGFDLRYYNNDR